MKREASACAAFAVLGGGFGALLFCLGACAQTKVEIVNARDVSGASGKPRIARVVDLGMPGVPLEGRLELKHGNGHGVIGEALLLQGKNLGKQPTVTIGGLPARVLAHASGGALVVRIPWGIDPGVVVIEVANEGGEGRTTYPVKRLALAATDSTVAIVEVAADARVVSVGELKIAQAKKIAVSTSGAWGYVVDASSRLHIVDLTGSPPKVWRQRQLPGKRVVAVQTASHAPLSVVVTNSHVIYIDGRDPKTPALYRPLELPYTVPERGLIDAALTADGRRLAMLLREGNQVLLYDAQSRTKLPVPQEHSPLPQARLDVAQALRFAADGTALAVLSGDNPRSIKGGHQAPRLTAMVLKAAEQTSVPKSVVLPEGAPLALVATRGDPSPPGTAIRFNSGRSAFFLSLFPAALLQMETSTEITTSSRGKLLRVEPTRDPLVLAAGPWALGGMDVVGRSQVLLAVGRPLARKAGEYLLLSRTAWGDYKPRLLKLHGAQVGIVGFAGWLGAIAGQP